MHSLDAFVIRRRLLVLTAAGLVACDRLQAGATPGEVLTEEGKALKHKFRGLEGGQLYVSSLFEVQGVNMFDETGKLFFSSASFGRGTNGFIGSYGAKFGVPKTLRVEWRDKIEMVEDPHLKGIPDGAFHGGTLLGNYTVPVASRIPDEVLDAVRNRKGGFRLKIRLHENGPLIAWDLEAGLETVMAGGDFREARMVYEGDPKNPTKRWVNGWYIHPKTKERIETDF